MRMKQLIFILIILLFNTVKIISCSCGSLEPISKTDYESAGEIFIGRVIEVIEDREKWTKAVTFEIIDQLKTTEQVKKITIWTALDGSACGLSTKEGERWYIFAYKNDNNKLVAGLCGRSVNLDKKFRIKDYGLKYAHLQKKNWKKDFRRYKKEKRFVKKLLKRKHRIVVNNN